MPMWQAGELKVKMVTTNIQSKSGLFFYLCHMHNVWTEVGWAHMVIAAMLTFLLLCLGVSSCLAAYCIFDYKYQDHRELYVHLNIYWFLDMTRPVYAKTTWKKESWITLFSLPICYHENASSLPHLKGVKPSKASLFFHRNIFAIQCFRVASSLSEIKHLLFSLFLK